jgi:hypothetical protein
MKTTATPTRTQLVGPAADIVPVLAAHAVWQEGNRCLHPEAVAAVAVAADAAEELRPQVAFIMNGRWELPVLLGA